MVKPLDNLLTWLFDFKNLSSCPQKMLLMLYLIPALIGIISFHDSYAWLFLYLLSGTCLFYTLFYHFLPKKITPSFKVKINFNLFVATVFGIYIAFFLYTAFTAPHIPIIEYFKGADRDTIAITREEFLKSRSGANALLPYIDAFFTSAILPYTIAILYITKNKYRHLLLSIFILTLLATLEKATILKALLPLIVLGTNNIAIKMSFARKTLALVVSVIVLTGFLSHAKMNPDDRYNVCYKLFGVNNTITLLINRTLWIPYTTAYDWLNYFHEKKHDQYLFGKTSSFLSTLLHEKRVNMEREVFAYEWGQNPTNTGNSNTAFFVDAYVNFGWIGVFVYSFILAAITKVFVETKDFAAKSIYYFYLFMLACGSLIPTLISNGLLFIIFFAAMEKNWQYTKELSPPIALPLSPLQIAKPNIN